MKKAREDNNVDEMKAKKDELTKIAQDLAVKLYQQQDNSQEAQGAADNGNDDGTVDGDFSEVNDDKK